MLMRISTRGLSAVLRVLGLGILALLLASCSVDDPQNTLAAAGIVAKRQQDLFWIIIGIAAFVFVFVEGLLLVVVIVFRRRRGEQRLPAQTHGNTRLEVGWTIAPALILVFIAVPTVGTIFDLAARPAVALDVKVTGYQWWWKFEYPGMGIVTANELHLPVGEFVSFDVTSNDVIHSFWMPKIAGKQDAVPGRINYLWARADVPGEYYAQCAELCGIQHALMGFRVIVQSRADFEAWVKQQQTPAAAPPANVTSSITQCFACHTIQGVPGAVGVIGPNLTHIGSRTTIVAGQLPNTTENLAAWLRNPQEIKVGTFMPGAEAPGEPLPGTKVGTAQLNLTSEQITALVSYLQSLK